MVLSQHFQTEEVLGEWMKEIQNILTEQDLPAIYYGQVLWYTVLRNNIKEFVPNPIYLRSYSFADMYREETSSKISPSRAIASPDTCRLIASPQSSR